MPDPANRKLTTRLILIAAVVFMVIAMGLSEVQRRAIVEESQQAIAKLDQRDALRAENAGQAIAKLDQRDALRAENAAKDISELRAVAERLQQFSVGLNDAGQDRVQSFQKVIDDRLHKLSMDLNSAGQDRVQTVQKAINERLQKLSVDINSASQNRVQTVQKAIDERLQKLSVDINSASQDRVQTVQKGIDERLQKLSINLNDTGQDRVHTIQKAIDERLQKLSVELDNAGQVSLKNYQKDIGEIKKHLASQQWILERLQIRQSLGENVDQSRVATQIADRLNEGRKIVLQFDRNANEEGDELGDIRCGSGTGNGALGVFVAGQRYTISFDKDAYKWTGTGPRRVSDLDPKTGTCGSATNIFGTKELGSVVRPENGDLILWGASFKVKGQNVMWSGKKVGIVGWLD